MESALRRFFGEMDALMILQKNTTPNQYRTSTIILFSIPFMCWFRWQIESCSRNFISIRLAIFFSSLLWCCVCSFDILFFFVGVFFLLHLACDIVVCMIRFYTISAKLAKICFSQSHFVWHRFQYPVNVYVCVILKRKRKWRFQCSSLSLFCRFVSTVQLLLFSYTLTRMRMSQQKKCFVKMKKTEPIL